MNLILNERIFVSTQRVYQFLKKYQRILINLTNYHLVKYLEKVNEATNTMILLSKIEVISKRSSLESFYKVLTQFDQNRCFYCNRDLSQSRRKTHVDHFIPFHGVSSKPTTYGISS